ncbi:MAG: chemotaxis response regulator protein-glutamate methylesterase [Gammaproteobacteria bacterium]|nr:chemotaxis response regulator protein-glutamate methylesterase [Gammaproteobacteria bacterium]
MAIRVLIVDDSSFFRRQIERIITQDPRIKVIGSAENGQEAVDKVQELKPDLVTMDVEMPVMNGIEATRRIMRTYPVPILMFSSLTTDGAKATLDALDAGAVDFIPKKFEDISSNKDVAGKILCERIIAVSRRSRVQASTAVASKTETSTKLGKPSSSLAGGSINRNAKGNIDLVAIGTSTGGPVALQKVLMALPKDFPAPIIMVQHMPGTFTPAFAKRLDGMCAISVKEAADGDKLEPGVAYLAPGGKQMTVRRRGNISTLQVVDGQPSQTYKPCVDITFSSLAGQFNGRILAVIMTGMGMDGTEGCKKLKTEGVLVWAQDEATSTVYGMPAAVAAAGVTDRILPLDEIGSEIVKQV